MTLDKPNSFSEPPLPVWNQRTGSKGSHLLFQLDLIFACSAQTLVIPGTSQHGHWAGKGAGPFGHGQQLASEPGLCCSVCDYTSWEHLTFAKHFTVLKEAVVWMPGLGGGVTHMQPLTLHWPLRPLAAGCRLPSTVGQERGELCRGNKGLRWGDQGNPLSGKPPKEKAWVSTYPSPDPNWNEPSTYSLRDCPLR